MPALRVAEITTPRTSDALSFAVSPDGRRIAFTAVSGESSPRLFIRSFDALQATAIDGTEGAKQPFWSPDGHSLGFFASGKLMKVAVAGGVPIGESASVAEIAFGRPVVPDEYRKSRPSRSSSSGVGGAPVEVAILPRPLQPELRCWVTANSAETWERAGRHGADVLALVGNSVDKLAEQIAAFLAERA